MLRIDHRRAIAEERARADHARIMGKNCDARFRIALQEPQDQLINERRLARATRSGETNDARVTAFLRSPTFRGRLPFANESSISGQLSRELHVGGRAACGSLCLCAFP